MLMCYISSYKCNKIRIIPLRRIKKWEKSKTIQNHIIVLCVCIEIFLKDNEKSVFTFED